MSIVLWSLGLSSIHFAEAANVTTYTDTLSTSEPSVASNHTVTFTTPTGLTAGQSIVLTFPSGFADISNLVAADVDLFVSGDEDLIDGAASAGNWNVTAAAQTLTITSGTDVMAPNATATIEIGTNATFGSAGVNQITNPTAGSYKIDVTSGADNGSTRVAIVPVVTVTASVDTLFTFTVTGVAGGSTVNTADTTGGTTTATLIPFGQLDALTASTAAQDLTVNTNSSNGFVVTVTADGQLNSQTGADIDGFRNGNFDTTAVGWEPPTPSIGLEETYGHWGITSDDAALTSGFTNPFNAGAGGDRFVSASTTPVEVFRHGGPADGTITGQGTTRVGYKVEISALQEAAEDYTATLTYVATPVF
jgi:hypothetical protein